MNLYFLYFTSVLNKEPLFFYKLAQTFMKKKLFCVATCHHCIFYECTTVYSKPFNFRKNIYTYIHILVPVPKLNSHIIFHLHVWYQNVCRRKKWKIPIEDEKGAFDSNSM